MKLYTASRLHTRLEKGTKTILHLIIPISKLVEPDPVSRLLTLGDGAGIGKAKMGEREDSAKGLSVRGVSGLVRGVGRFYLWGRSVQLGSRVGGAVEWRAVRLGWLSCVLPSVFKDGG